MSSQYRGTSPVMTPPGAGGEGPWWWSGGCGYIDFTGIGGERLILWGSNGGAGGPSASNATITGPVGTDQWIVQVTTDGAVTINQDSCVGGGLILHRPGTPITVSSCG